MPVVINIPQLVRFFLALSFACRPAPGEAESKFEVAPESSPIEVIGRRAKSAVGLTEFLGQYRAKPRDMSLGRALENRSGSVRQQSMGEGQEPQFIVRGLSPIQQRFFLEGSPLGNASFGQSQLTWVPQESVAGVDYFPDGIPLAFGADGLGGGYSLRWRAFEKCESDVGTRLGSFGFFRITGQNCFQKREPIAVRLSLSRSNENYLFRDVHGAPLSPELHTWERREQNGFSELSVAPSFSLFHDQFRLISLNRWYQKDFPGPVSAPLGGRLDEATYAALLSFQPQNRSFKQTGFVKWDETKLQFGKRNYASPVPTRTAVFSAGSLLTAPLVINPRWKGQGNMGISAEGLNTSDVRSGNQQWSRWEIPMGVGVEWEAIPGFVKLQPAFVGHVFSFMPSGETFAEVSPRLGVATTISDGNRLRASFGRFYRAPHLVERYGSANGLTANPELKPESALRASLGGDIEMRKPASWIRSLRLTTDVGWSRTERLISFEISGPQSQTARNVGAGEILFQELSGEVEFPFDITVRAAVDLMQTRNLGSGIEFRKNLPQRPGYRFRPVLSYEWGPVTFGYDAELCGSQFWDVANLKQSESFWQHNLRVSYLHRELGSFTLELLNLSDVTEVPMQFGVFQSNESLSGFAGFPAPGRRGYLSWNYVF